MGSAEGGDSKGESANLDVSQPSFADSPVLDRIPKLWNSFNSGASRKRKPPRPTLAKPRTTLLLPRTGLGWIKMVGSAVGAVTLVASALFGVRYVSDNGCEDFGLERQTVVSPEGLSINIKPEALLGSFGVRLNSIKLADFTAGKNTEAAAAAAALPKALTPASNFVSVKTCSANSRAITLRMPAPAGEAALNKLDLYGWDAQNRTWSWVGGEVDPATREIVGRVKAIPSGLMLVRTNATQPIFSIEMAPKASSSGGADVPLPTVIGEVSISGLYLGDVGAIAGDHSRLQAPVGARVMPVIRNWGASGEINRRLLRDLLSSEASRDSHMFNLVTLLDAGKYPGVEIDYRGLDLKQREQFASFVEQLAGQLQSHNKTLTVAIPAPILVADKWDVGGYDIATIGRAANYVKLDLSANPGVLTSAQLDSLLNWSAGQINRYKLQVVLPAQSVQQDAYGATRLIGLDDALAPLGALEPEQALVQPGARVRLTWKGNVSAIKFDEASQTYRYSYVDTRGIQQTVWINTALSLKRSLERLSGYNLRGITLRGLDSASNNEDVVHIVNDFVGRRLAQTKLSVPELSVAVSGAVASARLDGVIEIDAPKEPGDYAILPTFKTSRSIIVASNPLRVSKDAPAIAPTATPVKPANPSLAFELGGHARNLDHVAQMKSSGMSWVRTSVDGFAMPEAFIQQAKAAGLKVLVEARGDRARVLDEAYQTEWANHLAKMAQAGVDAIEVWDEPNYEGSWPSGKINGTAYTELLKKAYLAIKSSNSKTLVISGGLVTSEVFGGGCAQNGCDDVMFLSQMASAGAQQYMDCVGAHYTTGFTAPGASGGASTYNYRSLYYAPMRDLYYQAFGGAKPVCFTELGFVSADGFAGGMPANFAWASSTSISHQAQWLAESAKLSRESGKVRMMMVWNIDSTLWVPGASGDPQAGYAMIRPDGSCPACEALRGVMTSQ